MAENAYTLGLGRLDIPTNIKTDVLITLDILGGAAMADPFDGLVRTLPLLHPFLIPVMLIGSSSTG